MTRRVAFGRFPDGGFGLRASKPGYDVLTQNPDFTKIVFNSDWNSVLPVHCSSGVVGLGGWSSTVIGFSPGALSYVPMSQCFFALSANGPWLSADNVGILVGNGSNATISAPCRMNVDSGSFTFVNLINGVAMYFFGVAFKLPSGM